AAPTVEDHRLAFSEDVGPALRLLAIGRIELGEWPRRTPGRGHRHQAVIHRDDDPVVTTPVYALRQIDGRETAYAARGDVDLPQHPQREKSQRLPIGREARLHRRLGAEERPRAQLAECAEEHRWLAVRQDTRIGDGMPIGRNGGHWRETRTVTARQRHLEANDRCVFGAPRSPPLEDSERRGHETEGGQSERRWREQLAPS